MATCFCAFQEVSIIPGRLWTYLGYNCTDGTVSEINVNQSFKTDPNIVSFAPGMPAVGDACNCSDDCCRPIALATTTAQKASLTSAREFAVANDNAAAACYPCSADLIIGPKLDILGRWHAKVELRRPGVLHLVLFGSGDRCHYRVFGHAYFFAYQCLDDADGCCLDEASLEFTDNHRKVWIGTVKGQQVGPFAVIPVLPDEEDDSATEDAKPSGAAPAGAGKKA